MAQAPFIALPSATMAVLPEADTSFTFPQSVVLGPEHVRISGETKLDVGRARTKIKNTIGRREVIVSAATASA